MTLDLLEIGINKSISEFKICEVYLKDIKINIVFVETKHILKTHCN